MVRGGKRSGTPGAAYTNRTDLQAPMVGPSPQYGANVQSMASQKAVPLPNNARPATLAPQPSPVGPPPGSLTPLDAPTQRPNEPVTAGLPVGPGAGPEVLGLPEQDATNLGQLLQNLGRSSPAVAQLASYVQSGRA